MRSTQFVLLVSTGFVLGSIGQIARAAYLADDNASNYINPPGWVDGSNGGYGFTPWSFISGGVVSNTIATNTPVGTYAWDLQSEDDGGSTIVALRGFSGFNTNDSIRLDLDLDDVPSDGGGAVYFSDANGNPEFQLFVGPETVEAYNLYNNTNLNPNDYIIADNNPLGGGNEYLDTGISDVNGAPVHMNLKLLDGTTYLYSFTLSQQGGPTYTSPLGDTLYVPNATGNPEIDTAEFVDESTGVNPFLFNNFVVTPLPAAAIGAAPLLGILAVTRLKRK